LKREKGRNKLGICLRRKGKREKKKVRRIGRRVEEEEEGEGEGRGFLIFVGGTKNRRKGSESDKLTETLLIFPLI
jgi:hypothetical protein